MTTRRSFLESTGRTMALATLGLPLIRRGGVPAPSDTVVVAAVGVRGQGGWDLEQHLKQPGVACAALCDVDREPLEERAQLVERRTGKRPPLFGDFRRVLDQKDVDAVIVGTPDHWHCMIAVMALEAGKHVYVEKPMANSIGECQAMVAAARRHRQVVQVGQQQRSGPHFRQVVDFVRSGRLGKIRHIRLWANFEYGKASEKVPDSAPPETLDYEMWLGPAPYRPYNRNRTHGQWRFQWAFGGGLLTDWGAHLLDIPLWAMDVRGMPHAVQAAGGIFAYPDRELQTPDTLTVLYAMDGFNMTWEHTGGMQGGPYGRNYGIAFLGTNGTLVVDRAGWEVMPDYVDGKPKMEAVPLQKAQDSHEQHIQDFLDAVRNRREPNCPVEAGSLAATYAHLGNIAYRSDSRLEWDGIHFKNNPAADALLRPEYRRPWVFPAA